MCSTRAPNYFHIFIKVDFLNSYTLLSNTPCLIRTFQLDSRFLAGIMGDPVVEASIPVNPGEAGRINATEVLAVVGIRGCHLKPKKETIPIEIHMQTKL